MKNKLIFWTFYCLLFSVMLFLTLALLGSLFEDKKSVTEFVDPVYDSKVTFVSGYTLNDFRDIYLDKTGQELKDNNIDGLTVSYENNGVTKYLVYARRRSTRIITHEVVHLTNYMLKDHHVALDQETMAYTQGYWVDTLCEQLCD